MVARILLCDDDPTVLSTLSRALNTSGYEADTAESGEGALRKLEQSAYDLMLVNVRMPQVDGLTLMQHALDRGRVGSVIALSKDSSVAAAVAAMQRGAADFVSKPIDPAALQALVQRVLAKPDAATPLETDDALASQASGVETAVGASGAVAFGDEREADANKKARTNGRTGAVAKGGAGARTDEDAAAAQRKKWRQRYAAGLVGEDPAIVHVLGMIERVAETDCSVLITGPSGSGKELVAQAIHRASRRASKPMVALNCAAIPSALMESELFGHARGAFTGATERREGKFQVAHGGTLFLDEVSEMETALQSKFLRVLQEKEYTPVGDSKPRQADVRIVAASNQDLLARCHEGEFRADLYYRLNVIPISMPALRERPGDIVLLARHFVERANERHGRDVAGIDDDAAVTLRQYAWPGNVRELENLIERLVILKAEPGPLTRADLPQELQRPGDPNLFRAIALPEEGLDMRQALEALEMRLTKDALARSGGNKAKAAQLLGLKRTTLLERLKKLQLA